MTKRAKKNRKGSSGSIRQSCRQQQQQSKDSIGTICRVCARWDAGNAMIPIFDRTIRKDVTLACAISLVGSVDVPDDDADGLPRWCCRTCLRQVEAAYKLRQVCQESDRKLRDMFPSAVVVKEELDEANPLEPLMELVCKPELPELQDEVKEEQQQEIEEAGPDIDEETIKEDIDLEDNQDFCADLDDGDVAMDSDDCEEQEEADKTEESTKPEEPDCYEVVPAAHFRCCGCKRLFKTEDELLKHSQTVHIVDRIHTLDLGSKVQCEICYKTFKVSKFSNDHMERAKVDYRCKTCGETFNSKIRAVCHYRKIHGPDASQTRNCCGCSETFASKEALDGHSATVHLPERLPESEERPFECNMCYRLFRTDRDLQHHQMLVFKTKKYQCSECGKRYKHPGGLADHEKSHLEEKVFKCPQCPASYRNRDSYRKHIQRHNEPKGKFSCEICNRRFRSGKAYREHKRLHTGERPHCCPFCPRTFVRDSSLTAHIKMHNGQKDYECGQCGKRFSCSSNMLQHVNFFHQKSKPFPCFFCERRYPRKDYRKRHMLSAHPAELAATPIPAIELSGCRLWDN